MSTRPAVRLRTAALLCALSGLEGSAFALAEEAPTQEERSTSWTQRPLRVGFDLGVRELRLAGIDGIPPYYNLNKYGYNKDAYGEAFIWGFHVGQEISDRFYLEIGAETGPSAYSEEQVLVGTNIIRNSAKSSLGTAYLMPAYHTERYIIGVFVGWASFISRISADSPGLGQLGDYRQEGGTLYGGPLWRIKGNNNPWPFSIEMSYDFLKFNQVLNHDRRGSFSGIHGTGKNPDGSDTTLDFSSLKFKIGWETELGQGRN